MKIAVTGVSGHLGANLIRQLLEQNHEVKALVHKEEQKFIKRQGKIVRENIINKNPLSEC